MFFLALRAFHIFDNFKEPIMGILLSLSFLNPNPE